jgi:Flp pilus assembly protein TadD
MSESGGTAEPDALALFEDASGDIATGELAAAADKFRRCVEIDPQFFDAWHALGMALLRSGDARAALGAALMATELRPNDLLAWTSLSQIYVRLGQIADAEAAKSNARILSLGGKVVRDSP